jgi:exopolysaccharide biosynthesis polyprenyl glycosylphosphotransferase
MADDLTAVVPGADPTALPLERGRACGRQSRAALGLSVSERRALLVTGDLTLVLLIAGLALRLGALRSGWEWSSAFLVTHSYWIAGLGGLWFALASLHGLYAGRIAATPGRAVSGPLKVAAEMLVLYALVYFVPPPWTLPRHIVVFFTAGAATFLTGWRLLYALLLSRPIFKRRCLIVGSGPSASAISATIREHAPQGYVIVGTCEPAAIRAQAGSGGQLELLDTVIEQAVDEIVLATEDLPPAAFQALLACQEAGLTITPMAALYEDITGRVPVEHIGHQWFVSVPLGASRAYGVVKRALDLVLALAGSLILLLILPVVAALIRTDGRGPVFYRQRRVGRGGQVFELLKLRTMVADAESDGPRWARPDDPRATRVGRWLRRLRLDELPQVVNVLRGEMSVVGPRPERPEFVEQLAASIPFYRSRHSVRPGMTGWASVVQGYAGSNDDALVKLQYDLYYIKHCSVALDVYILLKTVATVLALRGR